MPIRILLDDDTEVEPPWLLRKPGFTEARFMTLADEDTRWELIDGEVVMHSPASPDHDSLIVFLSSLARCVADERGLGTVYGSAATLRLAPGRIVAADVSFLSRARAHQEKRRWIEGPCDWVCEVSSPSTVRYDREEKLALYQEHGIDEIWVIDPFARKVLASRRRRGRHEDREQASGRLASTALEGFWLEVGWLWRRPLPGVLGCVKRILGEGKG